MSDPTARFEQLYREAAEGAAIVPWDLAHPGAGVVAALADRDLTGVRTLVVGCGLGRDAEYLAGRGAVVVAFDIAPTAVATARARHADSTVEYVVADLFAPPEAWGGAFALVVENMNLQALPEPLRGAAVAAVGRFVAPGGTLLVVEAARPDDIPPPAEPPWPFTRSELAGFATGGLREVTVDEADGRLVGEFRRDATVAVPERLFHVTGRAEWDRAARDGRYPWSTRGMTVANEGFVHLSRADQVAGTLGLFFADVEGDLVLLVVDPELTAAELRLEGGFFHSYGELPLAAVVDVLPVRRGDDGRWRAPV